MDRFLERGGRQIVSLGAGSDTRFWRLMVGHTIIANDEIRTLNSRLQSRSPKPNLRHYVEIDFPHLTAVKAQRIARSPKLVSLLSTSAPSPAPPLDDATAGPSRTSPYTVSKAGTQLNSPLYSLVPLDLRDPTALDEILPLLDINEPTLFLAECALCYMTPEQGLAVIRWFGRFPECVGVVYEMCGLE